MEILFRKHQMFISQVEMDIIREILNDIKLFLRIIALKPIDVALCYTDCHLTTVVCHNCGSRLS